MVLLIYKFVKKDSLIEVIYQSLPPVEAGLLGGMLLGEKQGFEKEFWNLLKNSGLVHLVVVSGTNMMLIFGGLVENLAKILKRKRAIGISFLIALGYLEMVGWQIPVVRAMILVSVMYWAQLLGRKYYIFRGLILSVLIIILAWPESIKEVSFWLCFSAFVGVITSPWRGILKSSFWISLWISPIMGLFFGKINIISPISNLLVMMTVEIMTIVGFLGAVIGLIVPFLGKLVLWSIWPLLKYFVVVAEVIGSWRWVNLDINFNYLIVFGWYLILIYWCLKPTPKSPRSPLTRGGTIPSISLREGKPSFTPPKAG
jgi:competence protein ComEC